MGLYYIEDVNQLRGQGKLDGLSVMDLEVEGVPMSMEIDTGAKSVTLVGSPLFQKYFRNKVLSAATANPLCSCTREPLNLLGVVDVKVSCNGVNKLLPLTVVNGNGELSRALLPTFPARSWLSKIHGGLWRIDEFSAVTKEKNPLYPFRARSVSLNYH